MKQQREICII